MSSPGFHCRSGPICDSQESLVNVDWFMDRMMERGFDDKNRNWTIVYLGRFVPM